MAACELRVISIGRPPSSLRTGASFILQPRWPRYPLPSPFRWGLRSLLIAFLEGPSAAGQTIYARDIGHQQIVAVHEEVSSRDVAGAER
jgi:hypothetical protein